MGSRIPKPFGTHGLGREVGRLLTWNTLGAVVGVLVTGFVLMPLAGLRAAFCILALGLGLAAFITAFFHRMPRGLGAAACVLAILGLLWGTGGDGWRHVMSSGVFRARETQLDTSVMDARKKHIQILFYEDAADATVSVERGDGIGASPSMGLRINGKADASTEGDVCTQLLVGHLPILAKPDSKDVFILGLGCGMTAGALTGHPLERLAVAENCEPVIRAAKLFEPWNYGVLTYPLVKIWNEDARTVLKLSPQKYDVIITQPSNPWMAGVGSVFSREFYELASSRLKPGGIVSQWFHLYDMHDKIVGLVLRTFSTVFPYVEIWDCGSGDIVLLGAHQPWANTPGTFERVWQRAGPRQDLERIGIHSQAALMARQLASQDSAFAIAGDGPIQSDWFPVLEYEAPRAFYLGVACTMLAEYDERSRQLAIAPGEKRNALNHLSGQDLFAVFGRYWTVNRGLGAFQYWAHLVIVPLFRKS